MEAALGDPAKPTLTCLAPQRRSRQGGASRLASVSASLSSASVGCSGDCAVCRPQFFVFGFSRPDSGVFSSHRKHVLCMGEILFRCGNNKRSVTAYLDVLNHYPEAVADGSKDELIAKALEGLPFESASDLQIILRISTYTSYKDAVQKLEEMIPVFQSRMGAMLFLVSALLSRGLDAIRDDRDDPSLPLVTAPSFHASQEIVNLLLCGQVVANVFDERIYIRNHFSSSSASVVG